MAKHGSVDVGAFLVDGYDMLASKIESLIGPKVTSVLEQTDGLGDGWEEHTAVGLRKAELAQSGWYDDSAGGGIPAAFAGKEDVVRVVCVALNGNVVNRPVVIMRGAYAGEWDRIAQRGALIKANATYMVTGEVYEDTVIALPWGAQVADWIGTVIQDPASSLNGMIAFLQVGALDLGGHTGVAITVQSSAALGGPYADLIDFDTVTAARQAQFKQVNGAVPRYIRITGDFEGAQVTPPSIEVFVGVKRN